MENLSERQKAILERSKQPRTASNYSDAVDIDVSRARDIATRLADAYTYELNTHPILGHLTVPPIATAAYWLLGKGDKVPTKLSNCTLTATQWVNPDIPISRADTIINDGNKYGYVEVPEEQLMAGDLIIATNPSNNAHHTMMVSGFTNNQQNHTFQGKDYVLPPDHPIVRYSNGSTHPSGYRRSVGLMEYIDNSHGKTDLKYYRHFKPGEKWKLLPEITVTPEGGYVSGNNIININ